ALPTSALSFEPASFAQRLAGAGYDFWFYSAKDFWPFHLNLQYPEWKIDSATATAFLPDFFVAVLFMACLFFRRGWGRHALFAMGCFIAMLFPALGFFNAQFEALWQVSDHLQYAALPVVAALVAAALAVFAGRTTFRAVAVLLLVVLSALCVQRAAVFRNEQDLMTDTISKNPAAWGALNDLGVIFAKRGNYSKAAGLFQKSVQYNPDNPEARLNFGEALVLQHRYRAATGQYLAALKISPREPAANKMFAQLLELEGRNREAIEHFQISACINPDPGACMEMATLDYACGNWRRVVTDLRQVLMLRPKPSVEVTALNNLAWVLATCPDESVRDGRRAVQYAERACRLTDFKQSGTINTLAAAYAEVGRFPDAIGAVQTAIELASAAGDRRGAATSRQFLAQFQKGKPWRETGK
ncbi:MAG: tetratricopeptide repeat protein, partial [Limisphaerales bacterium]